MYISLFVTPRSKEQKFVIECNKHENTLPANMPSRTWNKSKMRWEARIVRLNIAYLNRNRERFDASEEVWGLLDNYEMMKEAPVEPFPPNYPFKLQPFPHQMDGINKLYSVANAATFADIGTGKSKIAVDIASCRHYTKGVGKVLVIALVSIKDNWEREIIKNSPVKSTIHILETSKAGKKRFRTFNEEEGFKWLIVGVESLSAGAAFSLCEEFIDDDTMIIIDESDSIKTSGKIRTDRCIELGSQVPYKMIMTGTPITQGMEDLFSQFEFLDKDIIGIGDFYSFKNRYTVTGGFDNKSIIGYQRTDELLEAVSPHIFQVRKRDVLKDLPPSTYQTRTVQMSAEQKKIYADLKNDLMMEYKGNKLTVKSTINLMQRFGEITGGFYSYIDEEAMDKIPITEKAATKYKKKYLKTNPKLKELLSFISLLPDDEPLIVWAISRMEIMQIVDVLSDKYGDDQIVQMWGDVSREDRTKNLDKFQAGKARFLVGNQGVGGIGLNMTVAAIMAYFSNDFSLKKRIQSEGRTERIGQKRPMTYVDFVCANSIDKYIVKALTSKLDFAEVVRGAFDSGEIMDLI